MTGAPDLAVSVGRAVDQPDIERLWRDLEIRSDSSFFLTWDWIGCWLRESGAAPHLVTVRHRDRVVAMALLQPSRQRRHHLLGTDALMLHQTGDPATDIVTIEHNDILVDRDYAAAAPQAVFERLVGGSADGTLPDWDEIHLGGFPTPERLQPLADRLGLLTWYHSYKQSWAVDLGAIRTSGGSYLDSLSANTRYQIRRSIRLYEARGPLTVRHAADVDEAMAFFDHMKALHQSYWTSRGEPGSFAYPFFERFHRALIAECLPKGTIELVRVSAGSEPIGYVYNFIKDSWVCAYHTGFRYEADPKLKPGLVSHCLCIDHHLRHDARLYDFLAGGERYKANLASPGPAIAHLVVQRPLLKLRTERAARWLKNGGPLNWGEDAPTDAPGPFADHPRPAPEHRGAPRARPATEPQAEARPARASPRGKALVLGDDTRSFLAIVRSLGRQGVEVHAAPENFASPALRSRYIARIHALPYWMGDGAEWLAAIEALLRQERFDLVIPCNETTLLPIQRHRDRLARLSTLALPDDRSIEALYDKHNTRELARSVGVAVAPGRLPRADDTAETVLAELGTPVVVKARRSYALGDLHSRAKVQIIGSAAELRPLLPKLDPNEFLYESFFPGRGAGVSVLASQGRVLQAFEHHRQRESGTRGSFYRMSTPLTPALVKGCADMVAALNYTGVAMFEFRLGDHDNRWVLLEVNARPWGSMPLPVGLGVDFPWRWYTLLVDGAETPAVTYRPGVYGRNLIPDLWATLHDARQLRAEGGSLPGFFLRRLAEFCRGFTSREMHDVLVADDLAPGLRELREFAAELARSLLRRLPLAAHLRRTAARRALRRALDGVGSGPVRIVFVCQGNICRSPFAAAALRALLRGTSVSVASFGTMPRPGRPTPPHGVRAAAGQDIDLAGHRSAHLSRPEAEAATAILVFDETNRRSVFERYPDLAAPVLRLGDFSPEPMGEIDDPVDGDLGVFVATYEAIGRSVAGLAGLLRRPAYMQ